MEFEFKDNILKFERELSNLDKLVLKFVKILEKQKIDYVIISGYIAILFGRSRNTEDIDLLIEEMPFEKFNRFWNELYKEGFWCINSSKPVNAFKDYLKGQLAIRFALKDTFIWNFEFKFPKTDLDKYSLENKVKIVLNNQVINTSKLELQIAYKLYLGSNKDIEDAVHLWKQFKDSLNKKLFIGFVKRLKVEDKSKKLK